MDAKDKKNMPDEPTKRKSQPETFTECIERVEGMASGDPTWDLSQNDIYALNQLLADWRILRKERSERGQS